MFEELTTIQTLDIPPSCAAVAEVAQQHSVLSAKLTMALAAVDRGGEWEIDGSASMTAWVRNHLGLTHSSAARVLRAGRRLLDLPATTAAWLSGSLSDGQIEILVANVTDRRAALWAQHEADLVPGLAALDLESTKIALQTWAARADAILDEDEPPAPPAAEATLVQTLDGQGYLKGSFDAEGHDLIATAHPPRGWRRPGAHRGGATRAGDARHLPPVPRHPARQARQAPPPARQRRHSRDRPPRWVPPAERSTAPSSRGWCCASSRATPTSTGSSPMVHRRSSTTGAPLAPSRRPSTPHSYCATSAAVSPAVIGPQSGARATTSDTGKTADAPIFRTSCSCAPSTTT